jgi:hypothetical protein
MTPGDGEDDDEGWGSEPISANHAGDGVATDGGTEDSE